MSVQLSVAARNARLDAIETAIGIMISKRRPLIVFPEGAITRHNDLIEEIYS